MTEKQQDTPKNTGDHKIRVLLGWAEGATLILEAVPYMYFSTTTVCSSVVTKHITCMYYWTMYYKRLLRVMRRVLLSWPTQGRRVKAEKVIDLNFTCVQMTVISFNKRKHWKCWRSFGQGQSFTKCKEDKMHVLLPSCWRWAQNTRQQSNWTCWELQVSGFMDQWLRTRL